MENMNGILVLTATNRADMIDPALLRTGRFDNIMSIPMTDKESTKKILEISSKDIPVVTDVNDPDHVDYDKIAEMTDNMSGADVAAISNTAVSLVIHKFLDETLDVKEIEKTSKQAKVLMKHFEDGVKKSRDQKDIKIVKKVVSSYYR